MSVLITGGTGFIGAEVARQLLQRGVDSITAFDRNASIQRLDEVAEKIELVQGDLGNFSHILDIVRQTKPRTIYHLGGMLSAPSDADPPSAFQANAMGTYHVLEAARLFEVEQVIFSSSVATYGYGIEDQLNDLTLQRPQLFYGACKLFGEHMGLFYRRKYGLDFRGLHFAGVIGPGVRTPGVVQYASWSIEESAKGNPFTVWVRPDFTIPIIYFKDAALSAISLASAPADRIQMVNYVVDGVPPSPNAGELVQMVRDRIPGARITFEVDEPVQEMLDRAVFPIDDSCARREWDWQPQYDIETMVDDFLREMADHPQRYA